MTGDDRIVLLLMVVLPPPPLVLLLFVVLLLLLLLLLFVLILPWGDDDEAGAPGLEISLPETVIGGEGNPSAICGSPTLLAESFKCVAPV